MKELEFFTASLQSITGIPYADLGVRAGFPSPAQDYIDKQIDLNVELIDHPAATFIAKIVGDSMVEAGIEAGDLVVIDKSLEPMDGNIVVAFVGGEFTIKRLDTSEMESSGVIWLRAANSDYPPIRITSGEDFRVWGVVTRLIKNMLSEKK